jgi:hypothetical protein
LPTDAWCLTNKPRRFSPSQIAGLTREQKVEAVGHNALGEKRCGWRAG